jgi:hypothetical protein
MINTCRGACVCAWVAPLFSLLVQFSCIDACSVSRNWNETNKNKTCRLNVDTTWLETVNSIEQRRRSMADRSFLLFCSRVSVYQVCLVNYSNSPYVMIIHCPINRSQSGSHWYASSIECVCLIDHIWTTRMTLHRYGVSRVCQSMGHEVHTMMWITLSLCSVHQWDYRTNEHIANFLRVLFSVVLRFCQSIDNDKNRPITMNTIIDLRFCFVCLSFVIATDHIYLWCRRCEWYDTCMRDKRRRDIFIVVVVFRFIEEEIGQTRINNSF